MIDSLKSSIKAALKKMGINRIPLIHKTEPVFIQNAFASNSPRKALLSYIPASFINNNRNNNQHTNIYTSYILGEILHELGYTVDVISWNKKFEGDYHEYDVFFGLGETIEEALIRKGTAKIIYFATGCNPFYCNQHTIQRVIDFYNKHGQFILSSSRFQFKDYPLQHEAADKIILHGSSFAKSTYRSYNIDAVNAPVFIKQQPDLERKNWEDAKNNYIWFGSSGLIHKGLDLLIDTFVGRDDINLHICGSLESEPQFYKYYQAVTTGSNNIFYHGYVDIGSSTFYEVLQRCAFVIFPSASEGGAASVITCMANGGLVPIVTASTDVDITSYGIEIESLSIQGVADAIAKSRQLKTVDLKAQSTKIIETTAKYHTFETFRNHVYEILKKTL